MYVESGKCKANVKLESETWKVESGKCKIAWKVESGKCKAARGTR